jgi:mannose-6-phosphate isomerase-like protein (cupin superfamily)
MPTIGENPKGSFLTTPVIHEPGGGESTSVGPISFAIKANSEDTQSAYSLVEAEGPTFATPHVHHNREEAFFVIEGTAEFLVGEERTRATRGAFLLVPRGTMHGFRSEGDSRLIIIHSPGGFERYFREVAAAIERGEFDLQFRNRLAEECGMTYFDDIEF